MGQILQLPATNSLFADEEPARYFQDILNRLASGKLKWDALRGAVEDFFPFSRLSAPEHSRSLLHLAVLDNQIEVIRALSADSFMKQQRDAYGLNPIDLARFLNRKEALELLELPGEKIASIDLPLEEEFEKIEAPIFQTREHLETILSWTAKAKREDEIPAEKIWMGIYFEKEIQKAAHAPVSVRYINNLVGHGVFAEKKIAPCSFVGEYTGVIQEKNRKQLRGKKYCMRYCLWEGKKQFTIDAEHKGNFTRFINHSTTPNLGLQSVYWKGVPRMIFVALSEIKEGSQLTFDYGAFFWKELGETPLDLSDEI